MVSVDHFGYELRRQLRESLQIHQNRNSLAKRLLRGDGAGTPGERHRGSRQKWPRNERPVQVAAQANGLASCARSRG